MSVNRPESAAIRLCADCGTELAPTFLACPRCGRLVHGESLRTLAADAEAAERAGDLVRALALWRQALALLPASSGQHTRVLEKVAALSPQVPATAAPLATGTTAGAQGSAGAPRTGWRKWAAGAGAFGVVLMKFKWVLLFLLTKAKVLLIGLTQAKTFLSMALMIAVYAQARGWPFALGLVVSIYIHEMGHVVWLRHFGIPASAPMFVPGLGAFVRLKARPATLGQDARIGLAGPVWGAAAALIALTLGVATGQSVLRGVAYFGAVINVFNLLPVWQLDGGRAFVALSRRQRGIAAAVLWALTLAGLNVMFLVVAIAATFRAVSKSAPPEPGDRNILLTYVGLLIGLAAIMVGAGKI